MRSINKAIICLATTLIVALGCSEKIDVSELLETCLDRTNMGEAICSCTANLAKNELSPVGFEFVVASLNQDEAKTKKLKNEMPIEEIMAAGMFMVNGPGRCAKAGN